MRQLERRGCYLRSFSILPPFLSPGGRLFLPARRDIWPCSSVGRAAPQSGVRSPVRVRSRPSVYTHLSRVTDLLTPRKDGETILPHKSMGVRRPKRPQGHGADCGKTLYRRLTASVMHRRRETAPCLQYRKCGWLQRPTTGGKPPVYTPPCSSMRRRRLK